MTDEKPVEKVDPHEWSKWITRSAFDICADVLESTGRRFGAPMLFGLGEDGVHHANSLVFWSNSDKVKSMELLRDVVKSQKHIACAFLSRTIITEGEERRQAMSLLVKCKDEDATLIVRMIEEDGSFGQPIEHLNAEGRLTKFWDELEAQD